MSRKELPGWIGGALSIGAFGLLFWLELKRPLRTRQVESKAVRNARNLAVAGTAALAVQFAEMPIARPLIRVAERRRWGLLNRLPLPVWLRELLAVLAMDYTLYLWHVMTHRVPFLWRFHLPHHADLDMDASTALRFHFGEIVCSAAWRAAQIVTIGVPPLAFSLWQTGLVVSILFHHSNVRLSPTAERRLGLLLITPRMHGIHHSAVQEECNSNWSSGLSVWDRLHGTLRTGVPQERILIGVPAYREPRDVTLPKVLNMPFTKQPDVWRLPDGSPLLARELPASPAEEAD